MLQVVDKTLGVSFCEPGALPHFQLDSLLYKHLNYFLCFCSQQLFELAPFHARRHWSGFLE